MDLVFGDLEIRKENAMKWNYEKRTITDDMIRSVEDILNVKFPEDFVIVIKKYDGGYPTPNKITIDGNSEIVNNLVSFFEEDDSYIIDIIEDTEYLMEPKLIPIAEDPFGNLYCFDFRNKKSNIVFWNHEEGNDIKFVCNNFFELLQMLHD